VLRPERFDTRLEKLARLEDILTPPELKNGNQAGGGGGGSAGGGTAVPSTPEPSTGVVGAGSRRVSRHAFITNIRNFVKESPDDTQVLEVACDIATAEGGIVRNWWLFIASWPLLLTFFVTLLDNMWKGRFMAAMLIVMNANGVYCPYSYMIYANWDCRGIVHDKPQICDVGVYRDAPMDPLKLYSTFGCSFGEGKFAETRTRNGTVDGVAVLSVWRNCTHPEAPRWSDREQRIENKQWCRPIPDNVVRTSVEYQQMLEAAVRPPGHEITLILLVMVLLPLLYIVLPVGRRWILFTFPDGTTQGLAAQGRMRKGARGRPDFVSDAFRLSSVYPRLLLAGYYCSVLGFVMSQFPAGPAPPDPLFMASGDKVTSDTPSCFYDWSQYPLENSQGCTDLEGYYGALVRDAAMLNLSMFLNIGTVVFFTIWNAGVLSRPAAMQVHRESRQLHSIHVRMVSKKRTRQLHATEIVDQLDTLVRYSRRRRENRPWTRFKTTVIWVLPAFTTGTIIRGPDEVYADSIEFRRGSVLGVVILLCNCISMSTVFYTMSHAYFDIANDFADMVSRQRYVSTMLRPELASHCGLPCIRASNLENLYGWLKIRRFVSQWCAPPAGQPARQPASPPASPPALVRSYSA
jgi:hypothetical protein